MSSEIITPAKQPVKTKSDLVEQVFEAILKSGEGGIFQTDLYFLWIAGMVPD